MYPTYSTLVKTIHGHVVLVKKYFTKKQESARKDVKPVFSKKIKIDIFMSPKILGVDYVEINRCENSECKNHIILD